MTKEYTVANDCHRYTKYSIDDKFPDDCILNGDNFDLTGCKKKHVLKVLQDIKNHKAKFGDRFIYGNHEGHPEHLMDFYKDGKILFTHGDYEFWGRKKSLKFRKKKYGKGSFGRFLSKMFDKLRMVKPFSMSEKQMKRCWERCFDNDCNTIVLGHKHPNKVETELYSRRGKTIKIIVLPRGIHYLDL